MKLILREYLASLKERDELDAILPDLLSELGYNVISRPARGTTQHGVDVAAVGIDQDGEQKLFLFSVKQGNLSRQDWDGPSPQSLRPSLNEILDVYIPTKIANEHSELKIVICLCFGGDVKEPVRLALTSYIGAHTTDKVSFREWNGDKLAEVLLTGILREDLLPKGLRSSFQKSVAMLDEPDVAFNHFKALCKLLLDEGVAGRQRVTSGRRIYICLWILFVWARDADNLEAPYRSSELALLVAWELLRHFVDDDSSEAIAMNRVFDSLVQLHLIISSEFLEKKVIPHVAKLDALSMAVQTRSPVDVNLKLFELVGRMALCGLWIYWLSQKSDDGLNQKRVEASARFASDAFRLIESNKALLLPLCDQHAIEVCLLLLLVAYSGEGRGDAAAWLKAMVDLIDISVRTHGRYPCVFTEYGDLIEHPREQTEVYREDATSGSILIPLIYVWLGASGDRESLDRLSALKAEVLPHCTLQVWLPDASTEGAIYRGQRDHGIAMCDLPIEGDGTSLLETVAEGCEKEKHFESLSAISTGCWPVILLACKHFRLPVPPQFWIPILK